MIKKDLLRDQRGLSQVVSTLIILVTTVLMASGTVAYYSIVVTSSALKQEQLALDKVHIWVNTSGAQAAFIVENIGGRDALIDTIEVKYIEIPWENVYHASAADGALTPAQHLNITGSFNHTIGETMLSFDMATESIVLPVGEAVILYIDQPDSLDVGHLGTLASIAIYTSSNQYTALVEVEVV